MIARVGLGFTLGAAVMLAVLCLSAGRWDVPQFWRWVLVMWVTALVAYTMLGRTRPDALAERMRPPADRDRATRRLVALPFTAMLVVAGLDARFEWSALPWWLVGLGLALHALGFALTAWVVLANPFASSAVRIQDERGQQVISHGPYALVRHPMYLAVVLVCAAAGPALGSWPAGLAALIVVPIFVRRTAIEDRMLHRELAGYADYAARVRWRIVPGIF